MREHMGLYRGKRLDNGKWVEGWYIRTKRHHCIATGCIDDGYVVYGHYANDVAMYVVDPDTIGECTGLIVKEKRWFEHDIISVRDEDEEVYRFVIAFGVCGGVKNVKHTVGYTGFHFIPANEETRRCMGVGARNDPLYWLNAYDCEAIGNIHDNPELLKGGEQ